ncbi:unnamed protein product, partial [Iphiclides podalirius]
MSERRFQPTVCRQESPKLKVASKTFFSTSDTESECGAADWLDGGLISLAGAKPSQFIHTRAGRATAACGMRARTVS